MYSASPIGLNPSRNIFTFSAPVLNEKEQEYLNRIIGLPLNSIFDLGAGEMRCREICEEIYDYFKGAANGDSSTGRKALQNISDSLSSACADGFFRKQYFDNVWKRINFEPIPFERGHYSYSKLNAKEEEYLKKFIELERRGHLTFDVAKKKCHDLGKEIFDHFKAEANGNSLAGEKAMQNIVNQLQSDCMSAGVKAYVSIAWEGVGDNHWQWQYWKY